jgi:hypothetical protein
VKDFDALMPAAADLGFTIGGEAFVMVYVRPEVMAEYEDGLAEERARLRGEGDDYENPNAAAEALERLDSRIKSFLKETDHKRYDEIRARTENAVPYAVLKELEKWMVETQSARPTMTPSPSGAGRGSTARTSRARSASPEATPAA